MQGEMRRFPTLVYTVLPCTQVPSGELGWCWPAETAVRASALPRVAARGWAARRKGRRGLQPLVLLDLESDFGAVPLDFYFTPDHSHSPALQFPMFAFCIPKRGELANTEAVVVA